MVIDQMKLTNTERIEEIMDDAKSTISDRGKERDMPDGERTIPRCVTAFNAITGYTLSNEDGWLFMQVLKQCRSKQGKYKYDDFRDGIGYAALRAEEAQMAHENDVVIPEITFTEAV
ncbi:hypothetical protein LCGC14_2893940, partial [marine sediment metagenome]